MNKAGLSYIFWREITGRPLAPADFKVIYKFWTGECNIELHFLNQIPDVSLETKESQLITLFVVSGSIKKFFSIDDANIYLFLIFLSIDLDIVWKKCWISPNYFYWLALLLT